MGYGIVIDRMKCQGTGACVATAPGVFAKDSDGISTIINAEGADDQTIMLAAEACPLEAISIYDASGEQVYP